MRKAITQTLITLLMLDAAAVAVILISGRTAWAWICLYWILLTLKNFVDWMPRKRRKKMLKEEITNALAQHLIGDYCDNCPYLKTDECTKHLLKDVLELMKEQDEIIAKYHKQDEIIAEYHIAESFLTAPGWRWTDE